MEIFLHKENKPATEGYFQKNKIKNENYVIVQINSLIDGEGFYFCWAFKLGFCSYYLPLWNGYSYVRKSHSPLIAEADKWMNIWI